MRGRVDFKTKTVNLGGTYVPLYGLNSALGAIPILGGIFVGREGEGVVGITFTVQGQLDDPNVLVNPISVLAPGIFRQIFEFRGEGTERRPRPDDERHPFRLAPTPSLDQVLDRADQHVPLLAERELDHAFRRQVGRG